MNHLTQAELNDYARNIRRDPHPHLAECEECGNLLSFLRKVWEAASTVEVPREVVEEAKGIFQSSSGEPSRAGGLKEVLARLVFLYTGEQQLQEVRSIIQQTARQAVYRYGDYSIDLRAEEEPDNIKTSLVGQISNQRTPLTPMGGVLVSLMAGKRTLQQSKCNGLGEFLIDFVSRERLRLRFELASEGLLIEVPLKDINSEG